MNMRKKQKEKKNKSKKNIIIKLFTSLIYIAIIGVLAVCCYYFYEQKQVILPWSQAEKIEDYTYLDIAKMSEKFAYYEETNVGLHFVIAEKEFTDYVYVIAINENQYENYKAIIDYTYERVEKEPDKIRVYGYPVKLDEDIKNTALKNIENFVPASKKVEQEEINYEIYLPERYLDTTEEQKEKFSIPLCVSFLLFVIVFVLLLLTIFDRNDKQEDKNKKEEKGEEEDA